MKIVAQYVDSGDATKAKARLREAGIMADITVVDPHFVRPSKSGAVRIELWVEFDDQFEDAVKLLKDPNHIPKRILDPSEMENMALSTHKKRHFNNGSSNVEKYTPKIIKKISVTVLFIVALIFLVVVLST